MLRSYLCDYADAYNDSVYSGFKGNIWGADLADMQLITKFNKGFRFLLIVLVNILWLFL